MTVGVTANDESSGCRTRSPDALLDARLRAERAALARLQRAGFTGPDAQGSCNLLGQNAVLNFFARDFPRWQRNGASRWKNGWSAARRRTSNASSRGFRSRRPACNGLISGVVCVGGWRKVFGGGHSAAGLVRQATRG